MASNNANPAAGVRGARQEFSGKSKPAEHSRIAEAAQVKLEGHGSIITVARLWPSVTKQRPTVQARRMIAEVRYTRDFRVPISADDPDMDCGWSCIPIPPTIDDGWKIFDSSKDYKTGWRRWHLVEGTA